MVDVRLIPKTECLKDTVARVLPYWYDVIVPEIKVRIATCMLYSMCCLVMWLLALKAVIQKAGVPVVLKFLIFLKFQNRPEIRNCPEILVIQ